jgi:spoIIIJ-associated protein
MSDRRYFSGDSEAQALMEAAIHFGVEPETLAFERVDKKHGFVRRRKRVMIEVDPADPTGARGVQKESGVPADEDLPGRVEEPVEARATVVEAVEGPAAAEPEPTSTHALEAEVPAAVEGPSEAGPEPPAPPLPGPLRDELEAPPADEAVPEEAVPEEAVRPIADALANQATGVERAEGAPLMGVEEVQRAVDRLLDLADLDVHPEVSAEGGDLRVNLTGPEREWLLEEDASLLFSLEHLTLRMLWQSEGHFESLRVDSDGYRERRERDLRERAREEARRVLERGEATELEALDPAERRIVHLTVQDLEGVESHSRGRGFRKRVRIVPAG